MSASELSARLAAMTTPKEEIVEDTTLKSIGQQVVASTAWKDFLAGKTDRAVMKDFILGRTEADAKPWITETLPGIQNEVLEDEQHVVDLMNVYNVSTPYVRYRRLTGYTRAAAVVPEKGKKPRAELTVGDGAAETYTIATGFDMTRQEMRDDAALVNLVDGLLRMDLREKVAALALNGTGTDEPQGILTDPDIQSYNGSGDADILIAVRKAKDLLRRVQGPGTPTLLLSVEDAFTLDTIRLTSGGFLYSGAPYGPGQVPTVWGIPVVVDGNLNQGTALLAKFGAFDLRVREGVTVTAFEQHSDYAEKNLIYVRAEMDCGTMYRFPKCAVKVTLPAATPAVGD